LFEFSKVTIGDPSLPVHQPIIFVMARFVPVSVVLVAALALFFVMAPQRVAATNGGCIACTLLTSTMTQLSQRDNVTVSTSPLMNLSDASG